MFLHLASDDLFINTARDLFEAAAPGENRFLISKEHIESPWFHVEPDARTAVIPCDAKKLTLLIESSNDVDALIIHGLSPFAVSTLHLLRRRIPILWLAWGYDVYEAAPSLHWYLYQPYTLQYVSRRWPRRTSWYVSIFVRHTLQRLGIHRNRSYRLYFEAIRKCTFCAPVFPSENQIIRKHCGFRGQFLRFSYGDYADESDPKSISWKTAKNILVGNSSSPTSNHIDAFEMLRRLKLDGRKVIVPLGYGDADYRRYVVDFGGKMLGTSFAPIVEFMPLGDYSALIKTCGICVFNHGRQQAAANILMGLWNGARVCLKKNSPGYAYFQGLGARVFSIRSELTQDLLDHPLDESLVLRNRAVVGLEYGREAVLRRVQEVVSALRSAAHGLRHSKGGPPN